MKSQSAYLIRYKNPMDNMYFINLYTDSIHMESK